jgi:hypothetical protein
VTAAATHQSRNVVRDGDTEHATLEAGETSEVNVSTSAAKVSRRPYKPSVAAHKLSR